MTFYWADNGGIFGNVQFPGKAPSSKTRRSRSLKGEEEGIFLVVG